MVCVSKKPVANDVRHHRKPYATANQPEASVGVFLMSYAANVIFCMSNQNHLFVDTAKLSFREGRRRSERWRCSCSVQT